jgi:hypothetical protein
MGVPAVPGDGSQRLRHGSRQRVDRRNQRREVVLDVAVGVAQQQ